MFSLWVIYVPDSVPVKCVVPFTLGFLPAHGCTACSSSTWPCSLFLTFLPSFHLSSQSISLKRVWPGPEKWLSRFFKKSLHPSWVSCLQPTWWKKTTGSCLHSKGNIVKNKHLTFYLQLYMGLPALFFFQLIKSNVSGMSLSLQIGQSATWPLYILLRVLLPWV